MQDTDTTFYKNINSFPKGKYFFYKNDKSIIYNYWDLKFTLKNKFDETEFLGKFENAVKSHLVSDVPVGVTLSGGMDSGSIAAIASSYKKLTYPLKAFSTIPPYTTNEKMD